MKKLILLPILALSTAQAIEESILISQPESLSTTPPAARASECQVIAQPLEFETTLTNNQMRSLMAAKNDLRSLKSDLIGLQNDSLSLEAIWRNRSQAVTRYDLVVTQLRQLQQQIDLPSSVGDLCSEVRAEFNNTDSFIFDSIKKTKKGLRNNKTLANIFLILKTHKDLTALINYENENPTPIKKNIGMELNSLKMEAIRSALSLLTKVYHGLRSMKFRNELPMEELHRESLRLKTDYVLPLSTIEYDNNIHIMGVLGDIKLMINEINALIIRKFDAKLKELEVYATDQDLEMLLFKHHELYQFGLSLIKAETTLSDDQLLDLIAKEAESRRLISAAKDYLRYNPALSTMITSNDQENDPSILAPN